MAEITTNGSLKIDKIYELNYKVGSALKTVRFEASSDLEAQEKGHRFVKFVDGLTTAKTVILGSPKKFAVSIDDEISRIQKLVDSGRSPFF